MHVLIIPLLSFISCKCALTHAEPNESSASISFKIPRRLSRFHAIRHRCSALIMNILIHLDLLSSHTTNANSIHCADQVTTKRLRHGIIESTQAINRCIQRINAQPLPSPADPNDMPFLPLGERRLRFYLCACSPSLTSICTSSPSTHARVRIRFPNFFAVSFSGIRAYECQKPLLK